MKSGMKPALKKQTKQNYAKDLAVWLLSFCRRIVRTLRSSRLLKRAPLVAAVVCTVVLLAFVSRLPMANTVWLVRSSFSQSESFPHVTVLDTELGGLEAAQIDQQLTQLSDVIGKRMVTLTDSDVSWRFNVTKLGLALDKTATAQAVLRLNAMSFVDKYFLALAVVHPVAKPVFTIDQQRCETALEAISIAPLEPKDAVVYFDQTMLLRPDELGRKYSAAMTCKELPARLSANHFTGDVGFEEGALAHMTAADIQPKLAELQAMAGVALSLHSGSYSLNLTPTELLALIDVTKDGSGVHVVWAAARLDALVAEIASKVNTSESAPALNGCQYLVSSGGNRLDLAATKQIFMNLGANSLRSYELAVVHTQAVVAARHPVVGGSAGTVYLTFDDGLTYGDIIMNYAACYGVKVTFFELGSRVDADAAPLRRAIAEGHTVQAHGFEHAVYDYGQRSYEWQYNDIQRSIIAITGVTGMRPTYFRPPGGNRSDTTHTAAAANGVKLILWGASGADTAGIDSSAICANVLAKTYSGASVLMHSTKLTTAGAVPCIIEGLAARGYAMKALY